MSNKKPMRTMRKMRIIRKTKMTNKKYNKNHRYTRYKNRLMGGNSLSNDNNANQIMNEVKKERKFDIPSLGNIPIFKKTGELAEGLTLKGVERMGTLLGINLSDSRSVNEKLDQIKLALSDPKNKEKIKEVVGEAAKLGSVAVEAASPFIQPLVNKSIAVGTEAISKIGESAVKIALNTATEIPIAGIVVGTVRSLSNAGEALAAASSAASEVVTASSDTINAATKNFERLMKEKMNSVNRINESVNKFQQPFNGRENMQLPSTQMQTQKLTGGNMSKYKMNKVNNYTRKLYK
jgi:hypothetical protein